MTDQDFSTNQDFSSLLPMTPIHERLGITILRATRDEVVGRLQVAGNEQPFGLLHGGASVVLAESLGSIGTALHAPSGAQVAGIEVNASHHRPATAGAVVGTATPVRVGRTLATWTVSIVDEQQQLTCSARITCIIRPVLVS